MAASPAKNLSRTTIQSGESGESDTTFGDSVTAFILPSLLGSEKPDPVGLMSSQGNSVFQRNFRRPSAPDVPRQHLQPPLSLQLEQETNQIRSRWRKLICADVDSEENAYALSSIPPVIHVNAYEKNAYKNMCAFICAVSSLKESDGIQVSPLDSIRASENENMMVSVQQTLSQLRSIELHSSSREGRGFLNKIDNIIAVLLFRRDYESKSTLGDVQKRSPAVSDRKSKHSIFIENHDMDFIRMLKYL